MNISPDPWVWLAAFLTLCIFSFLYRDNVLYRFAEHLFVGVSAGYLVALTWHNQIYPNLIVPLFVEGNLFYIIPLAFALCYFARFIPLLHNLAFCSVLAAQTRLRFCPAMPAPVAYFPRRRNAHCV